MRYANTMGTNSIPFRWLGSHGGLSVGYLSPITAHVSGRIKCGFCFRANPTLDPVR